MFQNNRKYFGIDDSCSQGLPPLNESQNYAIKKALEMPFTLIQGPPGTDTMRPLACFESDWATCNDISNGLNPECSPPEQVTQLRILFN